MSMETAEGFAPVSQLALARRSSSKLSAERVSLLIGAIYDCIFNPENWQQTLAAIQRELSFANSTLVATPLRTGAHIFGITVDFDEEWLRVAGDYTAEGVSLFGGPDRAQRYPIGEPILSSNTAGYAGRYENRYFLDILQPRGIIDAAIIITARDASLLSYVAFNRHASAGAIRESEVDVLRLLAPHFCRALTISNLFDLRAIETERFASVLDELSAGVLLVDESLSLLHANSVARTMLAKSDPVQLERGALSLRSSASNVALRDAVRQAAGNEAGLGHKGISIPASQTNGEPCVVHVLPLRRGKIRPSLNHRAAAALFVTSAGNAPQLPTGVLAHLYDLTPTETRIFELVCEGLTQEGISAELGIARSTVKTHLLRVFKKTNCRRQADLIKLAANLSTPVG